ncbi:MAG: tRNA lysidine(34) synthetase TilS [Burkholderiaceae bacterium]
MTERCEVEIAFERALEQIQARVSVLAGEKKDRIAVAYSGGLDSTVLLHLSCRYMQSHSSAVHAFHVHHGLSPNADGWLAHCRIEAGKLGAVFEAGKIDIDAGSVARHGVEQAARIGRYEILDELCRKHGIILLLAAHHQDDQAETVMLQLIRGAGLPGLSGMALLQEDHALLSRELLLGRPLLQVSRAALEGYATRHALSYVTDESNQDVSYRRNALRNLVFPILQKYFPGFAPCIARSAQHLQSAQLLLQELAASDLRQCMDAEDETALQLDELRKLSAQRCDNLLRHWLDRSGMPMAGSTRLEQLRQQLINAQHDRHPVWEFGPMSVSRVGSRVMLRPNLGAPPEDEISIQWKGQSEIAVPEWRGTLVFEQVSENGIAERKLREMLLVIRARSGRERLKTAHNRPSRSLKNLFQETAVPVWQRQWLPLFCLERNLVFVAGLGMDVRQCENGPGIRLSWRPDWRNTR